MSLSESLFSVDEELESVSGHSFESGSYRSVISSQTTSTNISRLTMKQQQAIDDESLATQESKDLIRFRLFLVTILFWTTIGVGLAVWIYFTESIEQGFEEHFEDEATELFDETVSKIMVAFGAIDSFALQLSAQFSDWPFVTVPNFEIQAERLQNLSNAVVVTNYHLVEQDQIEDWNAYTFSNDYWVEEAILNPQTNSAISKNVLLGKANAAIELNNRNSSILVSSIFAICNFAILQFLVSIDVCNDSLNLTRLTIDILSTGTAPMATIPGQPSFTVWVGRL